jgi:very-short-patch-repair endonuclease
MPHHQPPEKHRKFARTMRSDATKAEGLLWQQLKDRRMGGAKFRRQAPLDGYILDFVTFEAKLIIEVDGSQHAESRRDLKRDAMFRAKGFRILRFWNEEVEKGLDAVCRCILDELRNVGE